MTPASDTGPRCDARFREALETDGWATLPSLLTPAQCDELAALYGADRHFRSTVAMARHGFGSGEYRYFAYPLPPMIEKTRTALYAELAPIANDWSERLGRSVRYPARHREFLVQCARNGQTRPTPLLLRYVGGDYNCLHQDIYGATVFPLQLTVLLSEPGRDFTGGEFVITEQRPRMQSHPHVVGLGKGDAVVFAVHHRPRRGSRGDYRVNLRHGVSRIHSGRRFAAGIIFHDAE